MEPMTSEHPPSIIDTINRLTRASQRMWQDLGREPSTRELADRMAMPVDKVLRLLTIARAPFRLRT
jgi:RNA polymerase primary sigma factor